MSEKIDEVSKNLLNRYMKKANKDSDSSFKKAEDKRENFPTSTDPDAKQWMKRRNGIDRATSKTSKRNLSPNSVVGSVKVKATNEDTHINELFTKHDTKIDNVLKKHGYKLHNDDAPGHDSSVIRGEWHHPSGHKISTFKTPHGGSIMGGSSPRKYISLTSHQGKKYKEEDSNFIPSHPRELDQHLSKLHEEAPGNSAGGGAIAGIQIDEAKTLEVTDKGAVYYDGERITPRSTKWGYHHTIYKTRSHPKNVIKKLKAAGHGHIKLDKQYANDHGIEVNEEAPANAAGSGSVAGIGVGDDGEPGFTPKAIKKYQNKNKKYAGLGFKEFSRRVKAIGMDEE